jgi:hypothetical protein
MQYLFVHFYVFGCDDLAYKLLGVVSFKRLPAALVLSWLMQYDEPGGRNCLAICAMTFSMDAIDLIFHVCWILLQSFLVFFLSYKSSLQNFISDSNPNKS